MLVSVQRRIRVRHVARIISFGAANIIAGQVWEKGFSPRPGYVWKTNFEICSLTCAIWGFLPSHLTKKRLTEEKNTQTARVDGTFESNRLSGGHSMDVLDILLRHCGFSHCIHAQTTACCRCLVQRRRLVLINTGIELMTDSRRRSLPLEAAKCTKQCP